MSRLAPWYTVVVPALWGEVLLFSLVVGYSGVIGRQAMSESDTAEEMMRVLLSVARPSNP